MTSQERRKRPAKARTPVKAKYHTDGDERIDRAISEALTEEVVRAYARIYIRMVLTASGLEEILMK